MPRSTADIQKDISTHMAVGDGLKNKADLTVEELEQFEGLTRTLGDLEAELREADTRERMAEITSRLSTASRPAPRVHASPRREDRTPSHAEGFALWCRSQGASLPGVGELTADQAYALKQTGNTAGSKIFHAPCDWSNLKFADRQHALQRTVVTKGGAGSGAEWMPDVFGKTIEYLTYFSPLLGIIDNDVTPNGNDKTYFIVDDTAMKATWTSASGGSETTPTIPEVNMVSAEQVIKVFTSTAGKQKISYESATDNVVDFAGKAVKAVSHSFARFMEEQIIQGTGNGVTGVEGILQSSTSYGSASITELVAGLEGLLYSIPTQYRRNVTFLASNDTALAIYQDAKTTTGESLFDNKMQDGIEFDTIFRRRFITSDHMDEDVIVAFVPDFYTMRVVSGLQYKFLDELHWPHLCYTGLARFGGAWLGPTSANKYLTITS